MEEDLRRLSRKIDDTVRDLEGRLESRTASGGTVGASELSKVEKQLRERLLAIDEQLSDKASK
jgi:hypothetical protein